MAAARLPSGETSRKPPTRRYEGCILNEKPLPSRLSFSQIKSAMAMATKSNGKPTSVRTDLGPALQMRSTLDRGLMGRALRSAGDPNNSGV